MKIRIVKFNNKTRKGDYVYVKESGYPARYWKWDPDTPLDFYKNWYDEKVIQKRKRKRTMRREERRFKQQRGGNFDRYMKKIGKAPRLEAQFKAGIRSVQIDFFESNYSDVIRAYKKLLKPLVHDEELLDIIVANRHKYTWRMQYEARLQGQRQDGGGVVPFGTLRQIGGGSGEKVLYDWRDRFRQGLILGSSDWARIVDMLKKQYSNLQSDKAQDGGRLVSGTFTMTFRKGKT